MRLQGDKAQRPSRSVCETADSCDSCDSWSVSALLNNPLGPFSPSPPSSPSSHFSSSILPHSHPNNMPDSDQGMQSASYSPSRSHFIHTLLLPTRALAQNRPHPSSSFPLSRVSCSPFVRPNRSLRRHRQRSLYVSVLSYLMISILTASDLNSILPRFMLLFRRRRAGCRRGARFHRGWSGPPARYIQCRCHQRGLAVKAAIVPAGHQEEDLPITG